jgi:hypothetical protein
MYVCLVPLVDVIFIYILEIALGNVSPHDAINHKNDLTWKHFYPLRPFNTSLGVFYETLPDNTF